jgi:hypothetical protein
LEARDWDVISLQSASTLYQYEKEDTIKNGEPYVGNLYQYIRERFPNARYLWHHTWISQLGYRHVTDSNNVVLDVATQKHRAENAAYFAAKGLCHVLKQDYLFTLPQAVDEAFSDAQMKERLQANTFQRGNERILSELKRALQ